MKDFGENLERGKNSKLGKNLRQIMSVAAILGGALGSEIVKPLEAQENRPQAEQVSAETVRQLLNTELETYLLDKTNLSLEEINQMLHQASFTEGLRVRQVVLSVPQDTKEAPNAFDILERAKKDGKIQIGQGNLNIGLIDLRSLLFSQFSGAEYSNVHKTILLQSDTVMKAAGLEQALYVFYFRTKLNERIESEGPIMGNVTYTKEIGKAYEPHSINDIPIDFLEKYSAGLIHTARQYRLTQAERLVITRHAFHHELFHYFVAEILGKEGYEGPTVSELLQKMIISAENRFNTQEISEYGSVRSVLVKKGIDITNPLAIKAFSDSLTTAVDLTNPPPFMDYETKERLSETARMKREEHIIFSRFLDEMLAKMYAGALGHNNEIMKKELADVSKNFGLPNVPYSIEVLDPTAEEIEILRSMRFKGKSIL